MPAKKPAARKPRARKRGGLTSAIGPKATTALVICVLAGGLAYGARQQEEELKKLKAKEAAEAIMAPAGPIDDVVPTRASKAVGPKKVAPKMTPSATMASTSPSSASTSGNHAVTVTGCLEKSDEGYRLKDTSGVAAPKSRSWKSG